MSAPLDVDAQDVWLDCLLGDGAGSSSPASFELALFNGDPDNGGTEVVSSGGYVRFEPANNSTNFPDASGGQKVSAIFDFGDPSGPWVGVSTDEITHWLLLDASDSTTRYISRRFTSPFTVTGAETETPVQLVISWNTEGAS